MRYTADHRAETRARIVTCAARRFRVDGYEAASLGEIMKDAGLTVGGFYAHFASKDELFTEALGEAGREALEVRETLAAQGKGPWVAEFVAAYLNAEHLADRADGCPLTALGSDAARAGEAARACYGASVEAFVDSLAAHLDGPTEHRRATARAVMAMCVGALTVARAGLDPTGAAALFDACRATAVRLVELSAG